MGQKAKIIGLTGLAGSGKSEVALALRIEGFRRVAFADPLKSMLAAVGFTHEQLYGAEKGIVVPELGHTPRFLMQTLGTEWGRDLIHPEIWITLWRRRAESCGHPVVVDDVRFPNEVETIKAMGGQVWRVTRPGVVSMGHESEVHIPRLPVDQAITNDGTLHELREHALRLLHAG